MLLYTTLMFTELCPIRAELNTIKAAMLNNWSYNLMDSEHKSALFHVLQVLKLVSLVIL